MSRFKVGDVVRCWKYQRAEHGLKAVVAEVITIEEYGGPTHRGPHAYKCDDKGWVDEDGSHWIFGHLPDAMVVGEVEYQQERAKRNEFERRNLWRA